MTAYTIRRVLSLLITVPVIVSLVFIAVRVAPGDPAVAITGGRATEQELQAIRARLNLNEPVFRQYTDYLWATVHGDLGRSFKNGKPVIDLLRSNLPYTLELVLASTIVGVLFGVPLGVITSTRRNSFVDYLFRGVSLVGVSLPLFYLGLLLLLFLALKLPWFPTMGGGTSGSLSDTLYHLLLPSIAGGLLMLAYIAREARSSMLDVLGEDYVRTARAKGVRERRVVYGHALRNALISVTTLVGMYINVLLVNSFLLEVVFSRPGLGRLIVGAIKQYDYMVLQGTILVVAVLVSLVNLLVDLSYGILNPRIRLK